MATTRRMSVGSREAAAGSSSAAPSGGGVDTLAPVPLDVVTPRSGSGVTARIRDAVLVLDRNELVVALGKFAAVHNVPNQELTFLSGQQPLPVAATPQHASSHKRPVHAADHTADALGAITAMALDGKRQHLAICRAAVGSGVGATVSIHSLKGHSSAATTGLRQRGARQKTLHFTGADRFRGVAMSTDGKLVCCQSANASWTLVVWDWSRERQIAVSDVHSKVTRVRFNVIDMAQISTSGGNQLKLWTLSEYTLKSFASFKSGDETRVRHKIASYADHVWLPDDCLVALLDDGSVQLIINGELVQTTQVLPSGSRAHCIVTQNNGEAGVMVGGSDGTIAFLRIVSKLMKTGEKEMHLQRRMTMSNVEHIYGMSVDATGSVLVCNTEMLYGSYDLSNQCLLLGEDERLSLSPLASTPFVTQMKGHTLCYASRRPVFASLGKLPNGDDSLFVWNQLDGHECFLTQTLDTHSSPLCLDIHPTGAEMVVSFSSKVVVYFLLQDSVKVGFEVAAKHVSHVAYSSSGTHLIVAQSVSRKILIFRSFCRYQREPELVATFEGVDECIEGLGWSLNDRSFFYSEGATQREIRHCRLLSTDSGDIEEAVTVHSSTKLLSKSRKCIEFASCKVQHDSHDYVLFAVEQEAVSAQATSTSTAPVRTSSSLRAWLNGNLDRDALVSGSGAGLTINHDVTALSTGPRNMLIAGTADGLLLLIYWRQGRLNPDGSRNVFVMTNLRHVDLHAAAVAGLVYCRGTKSLLSCDDQGVVLVSTIKRGGETDGSELQRRALLAQVGANHGFDDDAAITDPSQTFVSVCQADEIALYDRNAIELRKLKQMDIEGELQQVKLENEMLTKQLQDQKRGLEDRLRSELSKYSAQSEARETALKDDWESRFHAADANRQTSVARLRHDAQLARDQYVASTEKLQSECERLRKQLTASQQTVEDLKLSSEEQQTQLRREFETRLQAAAALAQQDRHQLQSELDDMKRRLREALAQQDQDQMTQLSILSSNVHQEKARASEQLSQIQGKMAALHQEVKMLLAALNQKDHELHKLRDKHDQDVSEITGLKDQLRRERDRMKSLEREKQELQADAHEQKLIRDNLQRLNNVHRSQIELLQKNLLPKERELEQMQQHLNQLHTVNQEVVVQANLSDRLRKESGAKAKQNEVDVKETHELLEHVRNSVVVLQDELGELVRQSAVQEKCTIVGEIMRIHKRITRQMDVLQARDGRVEEVSAELHRQNRFLLKNKQHLRQQADISHKEKHKLVSALSFQNATLMNDVNVLRRQNKELTRMLRRVPTTGKEDVAATTTVEKADPQEEEVDGRRFHSAEATPAPTANHRPSSASTSGPGRLQQIARRSSIRPKSAAAMRPKR